MKTKSLYFCVVLMTVMAIVACDDSSSSIDPDPVAEISSSSGDEAISSSSVTDKGTSSGGSSVSSSSKNSSSSAKSSPSTDSKSSSSVKSSNSGASSSSMKACTEEGHMIQRTNSKTNERDWYVCQDGFYVPYIESSSSSVPTSSYINMDSLYNSKKSYGEFKDPRDGQTYKTIVVPYGEYFGAESLTVLAQNLNYGTQVKLGNLEFDDTRVEKFCYDDDPWYCDNGFGGLYSWSEAMGLPKACDSVWTGTTPACPDSLYPGVIYDAEWDRYIYQGVCPDGWHVMNRREYFSLKGEFDSGYQLLSKISEGSNYHGFSALYGGGAFYDEKNKYYGYIMNSRETRGGFFWVPHEMHAISGNAVVLASGFVEHGMTTEPNLKYYGLSVRCVKNY